MKVHELISLLSYFNPNIDVIVDHRTRNSTSRHIEILQGYIVTDETNSDLRSSFISKDLGHSICEDGKMYLDTTSELIKPVVYLMGKSKIN